MGQGQHERAVRSCGFFSGLLDLFKHPLGATGGAAIILLCSCGCSLRRSGVSTAGEAVFYPLPPAEPRVAFLATINDTSAFGRRPNRMARFLFGAGANARRTITKPFGLAAADGVLLVCDTQQNVVHVLDFRQKRFDTLGKGGRGRLLKPVAVTIDPQGNRYVADTIRREVVVFSSNNEVVAALKPARPGTHDADTAQADKQDAGDDFKPVALAFHDSRLYVVNAARHRVEVIDPSTGTLLSSFGEKGSDDGQMLFPSGIAVDPQGLVYVADMLNCRVQVFSSDGAFLRTFGQPGDRAGDFSRPKHLAIGPDGIVYVADAGFQRVQMFDATGRVLMLFGGPGASSGSLMLPAGICVDRSLLPFFDSHTPEGFHVDYLVFVSDQFGPSKVSVYAFGRM